MATANMNLDLPGVSVTVGPTWASMLNTALGLVDTHDHTSGKGVAIPTAGININADLSFNTSYKATSLKGSVYVSQGSNLGDNNAIFSKSGDLYWNNGSGVAIQITSGTGLNFASLGAIGGDYGAGGVPASVTYSNSIKTFTFNQDSNQPAKMAMGDIILGETIVSPNTITIKSPTSLATSYNLTLPTAVAAGDRLLQSNSSGALSYTNVDGTSIQNSSNVLSVKDAGITQAKLSAKTVVNYVTNGISMTIASPCVVTWSGHGLSDGTEIVIYTTGALPTGITAYTPYYVKNTTANTFEIAASVGGASINTTGSQSGSHRGLRVTQPTEQVVKTFVNYSLAEATTLDTNMDFAIRSTGRNIAVNFSSRDNQTDRFEAVSNTTTSSGEIGITLSFYRNGTYRQRNRTYASKVPSSSYAATYAWPCGSFSFVDNITSSGVYVYQWETQGYDPSNILSVLGVGCKMIVEEN